MANCEHCDKEVDVKTAGKCESCGKIICGDCLSEAFKKCPDCGSTVAMNLEQG